MTRKISKSKLREQARIRKMTEEIRAGVNYSLATLGMAFVRRGSGQFLNVGKMSRTN